MSGCRCVNLLTQTPWYLCSDVPQVHYNSLAPKARDSIDSASESSSSEDELSPGKKVLGSARLGRLFGA